MLFNADRSLSSTSSRPSSETVMMKENGITAPPPGDCGAGHGGKL